MVTGYELEDDKYEKFLEAGMLKMTELGMAHTPENFLTVLKDWWYILQDPDIVSAYVDGMHAAAKAAEIAALEATLAELQE